MKKINVVFIGMLFLMIILTGCGSSNNPVVSVEKNELGGYGEICQGISEGVLTALFDDEKCYFPISVDQGTVCYCLDNNTYRVNCMDAACEHTGMCKANISREMGSLLSFDGKLYKIVNEINFSNVNGVGKEIGRIEEYTSGKTVFDNPIPNELEEELAMDDYTGIESVKKIDENNLIVFGRHHNYLVDNNWKIKCWFGDIGKFYWADIVEDKLYYVNDLYLLKEVDLNSNETRTIDLGTKVLQASYMDGVGIVYTGDFMDIFIYDIEKQSIRKIHNSCYLFSIFDNKIYTYDSKNKKILFLIQREMKLENLGKNFSHMYWSDLETGYITLMKTELFQ